MTDMGPPLGEAAAAVCVAEAAVTKVEEDHGPFSYPCHYLVSNNIIGTKPNETPKGSTTAQWKCFKISLNGMLECVESHVTHPSRASSSDCA